jgi:hypothetical protein
MSLSWATASAREPSSHAQGSVDTKELGGDDDDDDADDAKAGAWLNKAGMSSWEAKRGPPPPAPPPTAPPLPPPWVAGAGGCGAMERPCTTSLAMRSRWSRARPSKRRALASTGKADRAGSAGAQAAEGQPSALR